MAVENREQLISALAASVGYDDLSRTKYDPSRYDEATGTLYCNGIAISGALIEEAASYFEMMRQRAEKEGTPESRHMALVFQVAIEAIQMMKDGGKPVKPAK